jgi:2-isopropylmalate synthase
MHEENLIYDWNKGGLIDLKGVVHVELDDETLRDGLQSPSVSDPTVDEKLEILHLMEQLGIHSADIGLPAAGPNAHRQTLALAKEIARCKLNIKPNCAARTVIGDITPIVEISQRAGIGIEVSAFIGSSPVRQYVEGWTLYKMLKHTEAAVRYAVDNHLDVMFVTEDTTRAHPDTLEALYTTAIENGARRVCIADTVGHATRTGTVNVIRHVRDVIENTGVEVKIDWHGHSDRGFALACTLAAIRAGVDRVHATALGIGERCGNTPMDLLLVNLKMMGIIDNDLSGLDAYCNAVAAATKTSIPFNYPIIGNDAFRTATGVHAAAIIKAMKKGKAELADSVYSSVPAAMVGRTQKIEVGPMSGESNVQYWLIQHGHDCAEPLVAEILGRAKASMKVLTNDEIEAIVRAFAPEVAANGH